MNPPLMIDAIKDGEVVWREAVWEIFRFGKPDWGLHSYAYRPKPKVYEDEHLRETEDGKFIIVSLSHEDPT